MSEPRKLKRVVIKEELVELTGGYIKALILNQMIYWCERVKDYDLFLAETKRRNENLEVEFQHGWIYKSAEELSEELMIDASHQTIRRHMTVLVKDGYILQRNNPKKKWDRTFQYRVDLVAISRALNAIGYALEEYALLDRSNVQNGQCNVPDGDSSVHSGYSNVQNGHAIPETTTYTRAKTNAKKQKRPPQGRKGSYTDAPPVTMAERDYRPPAEIDPLTR